MKVESAIKKERKKKRSALPRWKCVNMVFKDRNVELV